MSSVSEGTTDSSRFGRSGMRCDQQTEVLATLATNGGSRAVARARELRRAREPMCVGPSIPGLMGGSSRRASDMTGSISPSVGAVAVDIETTGINSRCISASIVIGAAPSEVWAILTDYDNLATHVPNLVESSLRPHPTGGTRLFQEGAQKIVGFDFRACALARARPRSPTSAHARLR